MRSSALGLSAEARRPSAFHSLSPAAVQLAFDRGSVRAYDRDGRLHVKAATLSKAMVSPYLGSEIPDAVRLGLDPRRTYMLLRDPDELSRAVPSFNRLPLLKVHAPTSADEPRPDLVVGCTGSDARFVAPYLQNSLVVWDASAIAGVETGEQQELSCGYRYRPDMTPGSFQGQRFDGVMRGIEGNHIAIVPEGRVGSEAVVGDGVSPRRWRPGRTVEELFPNLRKIRVLP